MYEQPQSHALATTIPVMEDRVYVKICDWKLMRVAGEINKRKNIYITKPVQRNCVSHKYQLYSVRMRNVYIFVGLILNNIIKASVTGAEPKAGFNGMTNMLTSFLKG